MHIPVSTRDRAQTICAPDRIQKPVASKYRRFTENSISKFAKDSINDGKIKNVGFVLNDVKSVNYSYGNRYGYGYGENQKAGFFKRLFNKT